MTPALTSPPCCPCCDQPTHLRLEGLLLWWRCEREVGCGRWRWPLLRGDD